LMYSTVYPYRKYTAYPTIPTIFPNEQSPVLACFSFLGLPWAENAF
jgi:hypothetical protein